MMRKGNLAEHPAPGVLRAAASEGLGGGIEFHVTEPVCVHLEGGRIYLVTRDGLDVEITASDALDDAAFEVALATDEARLRDQSVRVLTTVLDATDGWYFFHDLNHHALRGEWSWDTEELIAEAEAPPTEPAGPVVEAELAAGESLEESVVAETVASPTDEEGPPEAKTTGPEADGRAEQAPVSAEVGDEAAQAIELAAARDGPADPAPHDDETGDAAIEVPEPAPVGLGRWEAAPPLVLTPVAPGELAGDAWAVVAAMAGPLVVADVDDRLGWPADRLAAALDALFARGVLTRPARPGPLGPAAESLIAAARRADGRPPLRPVGAHGVEPR